MPHKQCDHAELQSAILTRMLRTTNSVAGMAAAQVSVAMVASYSTEPIAPSPILQLDR